MLLIVTITLAIFSNQCNTLLKEFQMTVVQGTTSHGEKETTH